MLYSEFINKATRLTIAQADNGISYLEPLWRTILYDNEMDIKDVTDSICDWGGVFDVLQLEVTKRNAINSKKNDVINWIYELIMAHVEPAILQEETDYVKQMIEFIKANHEAQELKEENDWNAFKSIESTGSAI